MGCAKTDSKPNIKKPTSASISLSTGRAKTQVLLSHYVIISKILQAIAAFLSNFLFAANMENFLNANYKKAFINHLHV